MGRQTHARVRCLPSARCWLSGPSEALTVPPRSREHRATQGVGCRQRQTPPAHDLALQSAPSALAGRRLKEFKSFFFLGSYFGGRAWRANPSLVAAPRPPRRCLRVVFPGFLLWWPRLVRQTFWICWWPRAPNRPQFVVVCLRSRAFRARPSRQAETFKPQAHKH